MLEIRLLGQFNVVLDGTLVEIPSRAAQSLLAYLALTPGVAHRREKLAGLLWPDVPEADARRNLRGALWRIRKILGRQTPLQADDITVAFIADPDVWVDALALSKKTPGDWTVEALIAAVSAYGGELLPGFYDEWIIVEREQLQALFESRIKLLLDCLVEDQRWEGVIEWGERWIARAGAPEPAYRAMMVAYASQGDLSGVAHTYQRCVEALSRDLGVEPSQETQELFEKLSRRGEVQAPTADRPAGSVRLAEVQPPVKAEPNGQISNRVASAGLPKPVEGLRFTEPPFKGLQYFDEGDASLFFGREALTARLLDRLGFPENGHPQGVDLLVIVGASGSGKSSLARAGLVPAVRRCASLNDPRGRDSTPSWRFAILTPGSHPLEMLAASLTREVESVTAAATLMDDLRQDPRSLRLYLHKLSGPLFLVVDQFEELFTLCRDEGERRAFVDNLLAAADGGRCKVVLTLRADFYAHCAQFENLRAALARSQEYIGPMDTAELRRAIEEPAQQNGFTYEPGLVDLILREVGGEPGTLPLLSHALLETWKRRQGWTLTLAGYAEAGGVRGAIAHTAERVYGGLSPEQQRIARNIYLRLTQLGEGMGADGLPAPDTRRRVSRDELVLRVEDQESVEEVLNLLAEARLVTVGEGNVEVAHEALIREWPALRGWLSEDRDGLRLHRRLTEAAQGWEELECEPGELFRGARLAQAQEWAAAHSNNLNELEREFLSASQAFVEYEAAEREAARQREVDAAQRLAEAEQRRAEEQSRTAQRFRWLAAGLAILLLAAVALASLALQQRDRVRAQARLATSRELAASALASLEADPERGILLALQALNNADTQEAEDALHRSVQASRVLRVFKTHYKWAIGVVATIDGKLAATSFDPEKGLTTEVWDRQTGKRLLELPGGLATGSLPDPNQLATVRRGEGDKALFTFWDVRTGKARSEITLDYRLSDSVTGDFSSDWHKVAVAMADGTTRVYDLKNGDLLLTIGKPGGPPSQSVAFSPDGNSLVTSVDNTTDVWDMETGQQMITLPSVQYGAGAVQVSPKRGRVAIALGNVIKIADLHTGEEILSLYGRNGVNMGIDFDKYGTAIAAGGADSTAVVWNALTGQVEMTLSGHQGSVASVAFIPYQPQLATASYDGTVRLWDVSASGNREDVAFEGDFEKPFTAISYSPDGKRLAVSGGGQAGHIYDSSSGNRLLSLPSKLHGSWLGSIAYSPDGARLATTNGENDFFIWDAQTGKKLLTVNGGNSWIGDLAYSPDGKRLATIAYDGSVKLWDPVSGKELLTLQAFTEQVQTTQNIGIVFSPDGARFATAGGYQAKIWDSRTGKELLALPPQEEVVYCVAFSPDGNRLALGVLGGLGASVWDTVTGQKLADLKGQQGSVTGILFSKDGKQVYTGSVDGTVKAWDAATGQELLTLARQSTQITGLALSPDGTRLAASSMDGTARVYLLRLEDLKQLALERLTRWFTPEECLKYLHSETCPPRP